MEQGATSGATNAKKNLDIIELEIDSIINLGTINESVGDQFPTLNDFKENTEGGLTNGIQFLKTLGLDSDIELVLTLNNNQTTDNQELLQFLIDDGSYGVNTKLEAQEYITNYLNSGRSSAFITPYKKGKKQYVVASKKNIEQAAINMLFDGPDSATASVAMSHEILHAIMDRSFSDEKMIEVGKMLETYLDEGLGDVDTRTISEGTLQRIKGRMDNAAKKHGKGSANYYQELFTSISDEMQLKNITWERADTVSYTHLTLPTIYSV